MAVRKKSNSKESPCAQRVMAQNASQEHPLQVALLAGGLEEFFTNKDL